jgi:hypothetical protein
MLAGIHSSLHGFNHMALLWNCLQQVRNGAPTSHRFVTAPEPTAEPIVRQRPQPAESRRADGPAARHAPASSRRDIA